MLSGVVNTPFLVLEEVQLCINSGLNTQAVQKGFELTTEGLEPYHDYHMSMWMHHFHQLVPHWSPISCVLPL